MQLRLVPPAPITPVPLGQRDYVPCLLNRDGELGALRIAATETWRRMRPIVQVVGPTRKAPEVAEEQVAEWLRKVGQAVGDHLIYLDVLRLENGRLLGARDQRRAFLETVFDAARSYGVMHIPVLSVRPRVRFQTAVVADTVTQDGHGVALRFDVLSFVAVAGEAPAAVLDKLCRELECEPDDCDLLLDLGFLDQYSRLDPQSITRSLNEIEQTGPWRSIVMFGSSIPATMGDIPQGGHCRLRRREWELWTALHDCKVTRMPTFGDYAIQNPRPPHNGGGKNMRPTVRYTVDSATIVARGDGPPWQQGQYHRLCQEITELDAFTGADYSDGDWAIEDCALGNSEPRLQQVWREAGTSHHLKFVVDDLRAYGVAPAFQILK